MENRDGTLRIRGIAPSDWIERARRLAPAFTGITNYDDAGLRSEGAVEALRAAAARLEEIELPFARGSPELSSTARLDRAAASAKKVTLLAIDARESACIVVTGHSDPTGANGQELSEARAMGVASGLRARGVPDDHLRPLGAGVWHDAKSEERARSVTFRVELGGPSAGGGVP